MTGDPLTGDRLTISGMTFMGRHGVLPEEEVESQRFVVDVDLAVDAQRAAEHDDLSATIDYAAVFDAVRGVIETESYRLIETLAETVAARLLETLPLTELEVRVRKPNAPLPGTFDHVEVAIRRRRHS